MEENEKVAAKRAGKANGKGEALGPNTEIGRKLKEYYDDLVSEQVPSRFTELLRELETREGEQAPVAMRKSS